MTETLKSVGWAVLAFSALLVLLLVVTVVFYFGAIGLRVLVGGA